MVMEHPLLWDDYQVVPMNYLVAVAIAKDFLKLAALPTKDHKALTAGIVSQPPADFAAVLGDNAHTGASLELPFNRNHPGREQALAMLP
jgi:hypothetical protein